MTFGRGSNRVAAGNGRRSRLATISVFLCLVVVAVACPPPAGASIAGVHQAAHAAAKHKAKKSKRKKMARTIKLKLLGTAVDPQGVLTDGERWAVYESSVGMTRIMDTVGGRTFERADPEGCSQGLQKIGGGEVLYECDDPECPEMARQCFIEPFNHGESRRYVIVNVETGTQQVVPGTSDVPISAPGHGGEEFHGLTTGSQWASGVGAEPFFVNLRSGQVVYKSEREQTNNEVYDLNDPGLIKPLCAPLTLEESEPRVNYGEATGRVEYLPASYDPPFAALDALKGEYLRRCGSSKRLLLLTQCGGGGSGQTIGGGVLVCGEDFVTQLLSARRYPWHGTVYRINRLVRERPLENIEHTATTVFASASRVPGRVYFARLPWAREAREHNKALRH